VTKLNQSVQRAVSLLRAAATEPEGASASELARRAALPWATGARLIRTLEHEGFLQRLPDGGGYVLGLELVRLAGGAEEARVLTAIAIRPLQALVEEVGETVTLTVVLPGGQLDVVAQVDPPRLIRPATYIGRWYPEHASSVGKLFLAGIDEGDLETMVQQPLARFASRTILELDELRDALRAIRADGVSVAVDELEEGLTSVSVGVHLAGRLLAMVSVSGPTPRLDDDRRRQVVPHLRAAAAQIERELARPRESDLVAGDPSTPRP
jgi:DNA-binding IclR family transcriptional regulator